VGNRGDVKCYGPNRIGLERKGFPAPAIDALGKAWRMLRAPGGRTAEGIARARAELGHVAEVAELLEFAETARTKRGMHL
jgi:UDP-N-acetylglucosamine acyltransferase